VPTPASGALATCAALVAGGAAKLGPLQAVAMTMTSVTAAAPIDLRICFTVAPHITFL
jgi:hypothetical protein